MLWANIRGHKTRLLVVEIIFVFLAARLFITVGHSRYSADTAAKSFFVKLMNADLNGIYKNLDIPGGEDEFINKEAFAKVYETMQAEDYVTFKVQEPFYATDLIHLLLIGKAAVSADRGNTSITVNYTDKSGNEKNKQLQMELMDTKKFFLFKNWHASANDYIVHNFAITVPQGSSVTVGGTKLSDEYLDIDEYGSTNYVIPRIFKGSYEINVTNEFMEDLTMQINTANGYCMVNSMKPKSEIIQKAVEQAAEDLKSFYVAAFDNKDYTDLKEIPISSDGYEQINSLYAQLTQHIQSDKIRSLETGSIQPEASYYLGNDGLVYIEVVLNYDCSGIYEYEYWNGIQNERYSGSQDTTFIYCLNNSDLQLSSISGLD